jgi:hypothetical protein
MLGRVTRATGASRNDAERDDSSLRSPEFRAIWHAEIQSVIGDQLARVALSVLVWDRTGSYLWTTLAYGLTFLPDVVAGTVLKDVADRFPRRRVMVVCAVIQALLVALMSIPAAPLPLLMGCIVGEALALSPFISARTASLKVILAPDDLQAGTSRLTFVRETGQFLGLAGAGLVIGLIGTTPALLLDAASYLVVAALLHRRVQPRPALRPAASAHHPLEPDRRRRPLVTYSMLITLTVMPHALVIPLIDEIGAPLWAAGVLLAADPLGMAISSWMLGRRRIDPTSDVQVRRRLPALATLCLGALALFAFAPGLAWMVALLFVSGLCAVYQTMARSAYLALLPAAYSGRQVSLVRAAFRGLQGIAVIAGGAVAGWVGSATLTVAVTGAVGVVGVAATYAWQTVQHTKPGAVSREPAA